MPPQIVFSSREFPDVDELAKLVANYEKIIGAPEKTLEYDPLEQLKKYKAKEMRGVVKVSYCHSARARVFGRMFAKDQVGFQQMARPLRHTLAHKRYKDIDIVNAHPIFLSQYCKTKDIACPHLLAYIKDRDSLLATINVPRDEGKQVVLSLLNGGRKDYNKLTVKPDWLRDFYEEITQIQEKIIDLNKELYEACKKWNREKPMPSSNHRGSTLNHLLCDMENKVLQVCFKYLQLKGVELDNVVPTFDGFMVLKAEKPFSCEELGKYVKDEIGFDLKFLEKPMNEIIDLSAFPLPPIEDVVVDNDNEGADVLLERFKDILKRSGDRVFIFNNTIWNEKYTPLLRGLILTSNIKKRNSNGVFHYSANHSGANALMKCMIDKLPDDPTFTRELWNKNLGKIFYKNGYYDFEDAYFYENVEPKYSSTLFRIPFNFPTQSDENEKMVLDNILMPIFNDKVVLDNYLALIARGLAGCIEDKQWVAIRGFRHSGKGVLVDFLIACFLAYICTFHAEVVMVNKNSKTQDVAKAFSSFAKNEWARLGMSNEITNDGRQINGNFIKGILASGGDLVEVRVNYGNEYSIKFQTLFVFNFNDCPSFNSPDCLETLSQFKFESIFSDEPIGDMKLADENLKRRLQSEEYISGFTHLLLKAYTKNKVKRCEKVKEWTLSLRENNGKEDDKIVETFKITAKKDDIILTAELKMWLEREKLNMSLDKLGDYLIKMGAKYSKNLGDPKDGKIQGTQRGYIGIKFL